MDLVTSAPELGHHIRGEELRVGSGDIDANVSLAEEFVQDPVEPRRSGTFELLVAYGVLDFVEKSMVGDRIILDLSADVGGELLWISQALVVFVV